MNIKQNRIPITIDNKEYFVDVTIEEHRGRKNSSANTKICFNGVDDHSFSELDNSRKVNKFCKQIYNEILPKFSTKEFIEQFNLTNTLKLDVFDECSIRYNPQSAAWRLIHKKTSRTFEHAAFHQSTGWLRSPLNLVIHFEILNSDQATVKSVNELARAKNNLERLISQNTNAIESHKEKIVYLETQISKQKEELNNLFIENPEYVEVFL
jgi:hypothetical protein